MGANTHYALWNRRLHYFLGLYFLFFIWLFALTGLLLNHHEWRFAEFWPQRKITTTERPIQATAAGSALDQARDLMSQLGVAGEIQWLATKPDTTRLEFRVTRPGRQFDITVNWPAGRAVMQTTEINTWGTTRVLHTFTGVRANDRRNERDWIVTKIWAFAMDAVAAGLVVIVASGVAMWWGSGRKRIFGLVALAAGVLVCGWLLFALRWMTA